MERKVWSGLVMGVMMVWVVMMSGIRECEGQVSCATVTTDIQACISYVRGSACCIGVRKVDALASTTANRRAICSCLKSVAAIVNPIPSAVSALPGICGTKNSFSLSQDCSKIP